MLKVLVYEALPIGKVLFEASVQPTLLRLIQNKMFNSLMEMVKEKR